MTIEPFQWDTERQRAYTNQKNRVAREPFEMINAHLDRYRSIFKTALTRLQLANIPFTNESIKQQLDAETGRVKKDTLPTPIAVEKETFPAYIERFVKEAETGKRLNARSVHYA
ncbi:hypothetical protein [Spirosoma litoris]